MNSTIDKRLCTESFSNRWKSVLVFYIIVATALQVVAQEPPEEAESPQAILKDGITVKVASLGETVEIASVAGTFKLSTAGIASVDKEGVFLIDGSRIRGTVHLGEVSVLVADQEIKVPESQVSKLQLRKPTPLSEQAHPQSTMASKDKDTPARINPVSTTARAKDSPSKGVVNEVIIPPRPYYTVRPTYPVSLAEQNIEGHVVVAFIVTSTGGVVDAYAVSSSSREFEVPAVNAVMQWRFNPGLKGGRAVNTKVVQKVTFSLERTKH